MGLTHQHVLSYNPKSNKVMINRAAFEKWIEEKGHI